MVLHEYRECSPDYQSVAHKLQETSFEKMVDLKQNVVLHLRYTQEWEFNLS